MVHFIGQVLQGEGHQILPGHKKTKVVIQMLREEAVVQEQLSFLLEGIPYRCVVRDCLVFGVVVTMVEL